MRTRISTIIVLICIILLTFATVKGIEIGNFKILSISQLKEKDNIVNQKIETASNITSKDYPNNIKNLEETFDEYLVQKQKYEQLSDITDKHKEEIYETKQYDIEYLWRILGKYATNRNLTLGIDVKKSEKDKNTYNLNFTVSGKYVNISQFITDIENNSDLYFRIYNFKISGNGEVIRSTFTVKNVSIDPSTIK